MSPAEIDALKVKMRNRPRYMTHKYIEERTGLKPQWLEQLSGNKHGRLNVAMLHSLDKFFKELPGAV